MKETVGYWGRTCDTCKESAARVFCKADSAFLCEVCDARVHGANKLALRHERVWMCEVCEQSPAAVTCKADAAALCAACDADIHSANPLARRHARSPVVPFLDSPVAAAIRPSAASAAAYDLISGGDDDIYFSESPEFKTADLLFSEVDRYLDLESNEPFDPADSAVPVQPKELAPSSDPAIFDLYSVSSSEAAVVPEDSGWIMTDVTNPYGGGSVGGKTPTAAPAMDREARVMRYREKRKSRRFEKTIRYASRKAYAETRPRIKGRFAKRTDDEKEIAGNSFFSSVAASTAGLVVDPAYGVVPSF